MEEKMKCLDLVGQDKDREITYQLLSQVKQIILGENQFNLLPNEIEYDGGKQR